MELGFYVLVPDLRGHGDSGWSPGGSYSVELFADDVRAWCRLCSESATLIGASLGGISSLLAAGEEPRARARGLILIDVAHRAESRGVSRIFEFMSAHPNGFESFDHAVRAVADYLPHRTQTSREGLRNNLRERDGRLVWHWDPRLLERFDLGPATRPFSERALVAARAIAAPILLVRGGDSDILTQEIAEEFCREVPNATRVDVAGARHMVAGDQNDGSRAIGLGCIRCSDLGAGPTADEVRAVSLSNMDDVEACRVLQAKCPGVDDTNGVSSNPPDAELDENADVTGQLDAIRVTASVHSWGWAEDSRSIDIEVPIGEDGYLWLKGSDPRGQPRIDSALLLTPTSWARKRAGECGLLHAPLGALLRASDMHQRVSALTRAHRCLRLSS